MDTRASIEDENSQLLNDEENANANKQSIYICLLSWMLKYFFFLSLLLVMILSISIPEIGRTNGPLYPEITSSWIAIILILFLSGISVDTKQLQKSTMYLKLNIYTQFNIYIWFPITGYILSLILLNIPDLNLFNKYLMNGVIILCCLPTSTASCIVFTQSANGNDSAAIVNSTIANLIGIILSPALIFVFIGNLGTLSFQDLLIKLTLRVIVPFITGQIIRCLGGENLGKWMTKKHVKFSLKKVKELAILFLIFCSLSDTFYNGFDATVMDVVIAMFVIAFLNGFNSILFWRLSGVTCCGKCKPFDIGDRIAILFVSMMKTAAVGIPIVETIYESDDNVGLYILPVILYQPIQVFISSLLVNPLMKKIEKLEQWQRLSNTQADISMQHLPTT